MNDVQKQIAAKRKVRNHDQLLGCGLAEDGVGEGECR